MKIKKILACLLVLMIMVSTYSPSIYAASESKNKLAEIKSYYQLWNNRDKVGNYNDGEGCLAFVNYIFHNVFNCYNVTKADFKTTFTCNSIEDFKTTIKSYGAIGDNIFVKFSTGQHHFILAEFDTDGITVFESNDTTNYNGNAATNKNYKYDYYLKTKLKMSKKALESFTVTVYRSTNNPASPAKLPVKMNKHKDKIINNKTMYIIKEDVPSHDEPYAIAKIINRYNIGDKIEIDASTTNYYGNLWYKLKGQNEWIVYDYLSDKNPKPEKPKSDVSSSSQKKPETKNSSQSPITRNLPKGQHLLESGKTYLLTNSRATTFFFNCGGSVKYELIIVRKDGSITHQDKSGDLKWAYRESTSEEFYITFIDKDVTVSDSMKCMTVKEVEHSDMGYFDDCIYFKANKEILAK